MNNIGDDKPPRDHVLAEIGRERDRQLDVEGFSYEHDDEHTRGQIGLAAAVYAGWGAAGTEIGKLWPWDGRWFKPTTFRRNLIKAGALIVAEIERIDRKAAGKVK